MPPRREDPHDRDLQRAARALEVFDPLAALQLVALRQEPQALALRGIAMAQLGDYGAARRLLRRAVRGLARIDPRARARCLAAAGEVALAARDLPAAAATLDAAAAALEATRDRTNAVFARLQGVRCAMWLGDLAGAQATLASLDLRGSPSRLRAVAALTGAEIASRALRARDARALLARARAAAREAAIPALVTEVDRAERDLDAPVARLLSGASERWVTLAEVESLAGSSDLVIDACRRQLRRGDTVVDLVTRPVLLALATSLGARAPAAAARDELVQQAFGARRATESMRARLRVEIGRLRRAIAPLARVDAADPGYALRTRDGARVVVLLPPSPGEESALLALLRGGETWSTSALAAAVGASRRTVQRALLSLRESGRAEAMGKGRALRWVAATSPGFATTLLLHLRPQAR
jgi:hypothetical protein